MSKKLLNLCMVALLSVISTAAWALDQVDGVYQIGTADDFNAFATLVNGGEVTANAVLTADIDLGTNVTMIGASDAQGKRYDGTFDGKGHSITIDLTLTEQYAALFRYVGWRAVIQNLKVQGSVTTNSKFAGGIAGLNRGTIRNCYVDVTINSTLTGDATHGGVAANCYNGTIIENCLVKVKILGETTQNCGGVVGWASSPVNIVNCLVITDGSTLDISNGASANISRNPGNAKVVDLQTYNQDIYANRPGGSCYNNYVTQQWGNNNATTVVPLEDLADGKICYQLNNDQSRIAWVQTIGKDPFPVPAAFGEGQVYASGATGCNGLGEGLTYSNEGTAQATAHQFDKYGICSKCGLFNFHYWDPDDPTKFDPVTRTVFLASKEDIDVAEGMNRIINGFKLHMKMTNDIEYIAEPGHYIFNPSDWTEGDFNGGGHALTIEMTDMGNNAALFPVRHYGSVEDLILHGKITTSGQYWGSISNDSYERLVRNVYSDINFTSTRVGDNTAGGFFGMVRTEKKVENCIYAGTINLPGADGGAKCARIGGFAGWSHAKTYYTNCAILGTINGAGDQTLDNDTENSQNITRNPGNVVTENVYVLNPIRGNSVSDHDKYIFFGEVTETTETNENGETVTVKNYVPNIEGVANGELTFLLNGKQNGFDRFYQLIGTDPEPMPIAKEGALVYSVAGQYRCDGTPLGDVTYSNTPSTAEIPDHTNSDGWCTVCGNLIEDYMTPVDGWYEISNATQLAWWSNYATKYPTVKGRLTADINMDGKMTRFIPIGSQANLFVGEFDGQGHVIKNFVYTGGDYSGLFGVIGGGAVIKNFVLDSTCSITGNAFCGAIGGTNGGGDVYISNVGNEGTVTGGAQNASGIIGVDMGGSANLFITNCYVMGAISGARESATICSWSSANSVIKNCWSSATLEGKLNEDSFTRGSAACVNCYEIDEVGTQNNKEGANRTNLFTAEELANGALCAKLNTVDFRQNVGEDAHPVFNQTHAVVKEITEAGYATMYIPAEVTIPEGVSVFTGEFEETWLKLNPVEGTVPALEPVVLKGTKGYYGFKPAAAATESVTVTFSELGLDDQAVISEPVVVGNLTINFAQGTNTQNLAPKYYNSGSAVRIYAGNTMSISAGGATITKIVFTLTQGAPTFESGSYNNGTWEGEETTVTAGASSQTRIKSMVVYYSVAGEGIANIEGNVLKGTAEEIDAAGKYILAQPEGEPVGFYLANGGKIAAGKAYLEVPAGTEVKAFLFGADDATGIANVEKTIENGAIYNLAGQRISKMQKGVNIINGKKVLK